MEKFVFSYSPHNVARPEFKQDIENFAGSIHDLRVGRKVALEAVIGVNLERTAGLIKLDGRFHRTETKFHQRHLLDLGTAQVFDKELRPYVRREWDDKGKEVYSK